MDSNSWFGDFTDPWGKLCLSMPYVATPIGQICWHCNEAIQENDEGQMMPCGDAKRPIHRECLLRSIMGSVGHQQKRCSCYGGTEEDPPGMTKRKAAIAATQFFERSRKRP